MIKYLLPFNWGYRPKPHAARLASLGEQVNSSSCFSVFYNASTAAALACLFATMLVLVHLQHQAPVAPNPAAAIMAETVTPPRIFSQADTALYRTLLANPTQQQQHEAASRINNPLLVPLLTKTATAEIYDTTIERFGKALLNKHLKGHPLRSRIAQLLKAERRQQALTLLAQAGRRLPARTYDLLRWQIAGSLFNNGHYAQAAMLAAASANRSGREIPALHWLAGIAEWHCGRLAPSYRHFASMLRQKNHLTREDAAAANFWAYRTVTALGNHQAAVRYLNRAAEIRGSFYGIQAAQATLAAFEKTATAQAPLTASKWQKLSRKPALQRVLALTEIGAKELAAQELLQHFETASLKTRPMLRQVAQDLALRPTLDVAADSAAYPLPRWRSNTGKGEDSALIFAIARQESGFNPHARSHAGAMGVMQLMPETARFLQARFSVATGSGASQHYQLGQHYLRYLQQLPSVADNLVYLIAAYNAGPSPVAQWKQTFTQHDPLLFIESIPYAETRGYVLQVLRNYWVYTQLIGGENRSVDALLAGKWPLSPLARQQVASGSTADSKDSNGRAL